MESAVEDGLRARIITWVQAQAEDNGPSPIESSFSMILLAESKISRTCRHWSTNTHAA